MHFVERISDNPILIPNPTNPWEAEGAFNASVTFANNEYHLVFRALSSKDSYRGSLMQISTIGYAKSMDGIHFGEHQQIITPTNEWEIFGCEDPRITYIDGKFYIFYTALSTYPFGANGIKLALAVTTDFKTFEKYPVTPFNAKAMAMFPEKINGKYAALLTPHTDMPPAKIALALFDTIEDIHNGTYWNSWYENLDDHVIPLLESLHDQVELGATPIKTEYGWLVFYSYIKNYFTPKRSFGIEAVLLDLTNPQKIIGRTSSLLSAEKEYEVIGNIQNVIFPSGAIKKDEMIFLYYGAADTRTCVAKIELEPLYEHLGINTQKHTRYSHDELVDTFERFDENPILAPIPEFAWEARAVFNPAAFLHENITHIIYRAMSQDNTSVFGYAKTIDGFHIEERLSYPIYTPREEFEKKTKAFGNSGCEDPRVSFIDNRIYICYTAYDGSNPPRVAVTSISLNHFLQKNWNWDIPKLISPPGADDKDACILEEKINGSYYIFHRLGHSIWVDQIDNLNFTEGKWLGGKVIMDTRSDKWDNLKIGIASPPMKTENGWILLYHGVSEDKHYRVGAVLLDLADPTKIIGRTDQPLFSPELIYEIEGEIPNVVFPCGSVIKDGKIFIYYGGADKVIGVAMMPLEKLLSLFAAD